MTTQKIQLGDRVRFKINGFTGIATSITEDLQQCRQVFVRPEKLDKEGKQAEGHWFDEPWLEIVKVAVFTPKAAVEQVVGGRRERVSGAERGRPHPPSRRP